MDERIRTVLADTAYAEVLELVHSRLQRQGLDSKTVTLPPLADHLRQAVADLQGLPLIPANPVRLHVAKLDAALRQSSAAAGLLEVLVALFGPLQDARQQRRDAAQAQQTMWEAAAADPLLVARPQLAPWIAELRERGLLRRAAAALGADDPTVLRHALAAVARLGGPGILMPVLATEVAGDAHALDAGRPLAGLVLRAARHLAGWPELPSDAAQRRRLWAEVGVICDPLSCDVLCSGLRPRADNLLARHLCDYADSGAPTRVTLRELSHHTVVVESGTPIFVCENPGVVTLAADSLGIHGAPLICTEGIPTTAAIKLLTMLREAGARLHFHSDFDWNGIRIGNWLIGELGAQPWRFMTPDYTAALSTSGERLPLRGYPAVPRWDESLGAAMGQANAVVFEEQVVQVLLGDLAN